MTTTEPAELLRRWVNGNASIDLYKDGTRVIEYEDELRLDFPLNIDIRVSTQCAFGLNEKTGRSICNFCHESATVEGKDADYSRLKDVLAGLPAGVELALGINQFSSELFDFLHHCKENSWVVNGTVNQGLVFRDRAHLTRCIEEGLLHGIGISYRSGMKHIPKFLVEYPQTVAHVIAGLDSFEEIKSLANQGVSKILVLGEKDFGFNKGRVDLTSRSHVDWYRKIHELFKLFQVVSFDNLALEQLKVRRFVLNWDEMYQGEHSFYINAVEGYFSPSSRSPEKTKWEDLSLRQYFAQLEKMGHSRN